MLDLQHGGKKGFSTLRRKDEIEINGLIWMGLQIHGPTNRRKNLRGFNCVKLKIGAIDWEQEKGLLKNIRSRFSKEEIELRVDANTFLPQNAMEKLKVLADLEIHSIEQPIMAGQLEEMAQLCAKTPTPIALDEELVKISDKRVYLRYTTRIYHFKAKFNWGVKSRIAGSLVEELNVGWWATSALEGNIGLNAIAQFAYQTGNKMPQ